MNLKNILLLVAACTICGCYQGTNLALLELDDWLDECIKNSDNLKEEASCQSKYLGIINTCKIDDIVDSMCIESRIKSKKTNLR